MVRQDMPERNVRAQLTHAARRSAWLAPAAPPDDTHTVICAAESEQHLLEIASRLSAAGIRYILVREPDAPFHGAATAIGVCPGERAPVRKLLSDLPTMK